MLIIKYYYYYLVADYATDKTFVVPSLRDKWVECYHKTKILAAATDEDKTCVRNYYINQIGKIPIRFVKADICSLSSFVVTVNTKPIETTTKAILTDGTKNIEFSCKINDFTLTCFASTANEGEFKLKSMEGDSLYIISDTFDNKIEFKPEYVTIGIQSEPNQKVNDKHKQFIVELVSSTVETPKIYSRNDENNECECERKENKLECTLNEVTEEEYEIYYKNKCGYLESTGIILTNSFNYLMINKIILGLVIFIFI